MLYNKDEHSRYVRMAGKISIAAAIVGFAVFLVAFLVDVGSQELSKVSAQTATTTLTVLNTPPQFELNAFESPDSATSSPVNTGDSMVWQAIGEDSNNAPYFLLVCSTNATPTANAAATINDLGTEPPQCSSTSTIQWGVSASTTSGSIATVSTTTASTAISQFAEVNTWYAWVCDDDPFNPRCNNVPVQGPTSTTASSSPFHVNNPPNLINAYNNGPVDPGGLLSFLSTSTDPDTVGGADELLIVVCQNPGDYNASTNDCDSNFIASTTVSFTSNATATYQLPVIIQDDTYLAAVFLIDEHGHEANANPIIANFDVNNVAPTVTGSSINLNSGLDMVLTEAGGETTGFLLDFLIDDSNSCEAAGGGDEIIDFTAAVFRAGLNSTSTCSGLAGDYNPNNCYPSGVATTTWNLSCTASSTSCTGAGDSNVLYECTFPLWFVADPTDAAAPTAFELDNWSAGVAGIDDDFATSSMATSTSAVEIQSFLAFDLATAEIPYGSLEPGDDSGSLNATTTFQATGNVGLDQELGGDAMCGTYSLSTPCPVSASSTIPRDQQKFGTTSLSYASPQAQVLTATTSPTELEINILKSTSTVNFSEGVTYWGIAVPVTITLAGSYQGLNTFTGVVAEPADWE